MLLSAVAAWPVLQLMKRVHQFIKQPYSFTCNIGILAFVDRVES
jgi:hypothetical protein